MTNYNKGAYYRYMRRIGSTISGALSTLLFASQTFAQGGAPPVISACPPGEFNTLCALGATDFGKTLGAITNFIFFGALVIALIFLIWGGIKWLASGGDKTAVEEARNHITAAIIGLVIIFLAYLIINVISFFFFGTALSGIPIPQLGP